MSRAVNQTIAWIAAFFLSLIVFGIGLAIVFSLKPKHKDEHGSHDDEQESSHSEHHDAAEPEHGKDSHGAEKPADEGHGKAKIEHEEPHAKEEGGAAHGEEEKEITPASVKAKTEEHTPEAKPHH